jgi:hypothetical protein
MASAQSDPIAFAGWVKVIAMREALQILRKRGPIAQVRLQDDDMRIIQSQLDVSLLRHLGEAE